jgi:hypothetical protein
LAPITDREPTGAPWTESRKASLAEVSGGLVRRFP